MDNIPEGQRELIEHIHELIRYWRTVDTDGDRMEGLAFSILVALDGCGNVSKKAISRKVLECGYLHEIFHELQ